VHSFTDLDARLAQVPGAVVQQLAQIERAAGREDRYRSQMPVLLESLSYRARIESVRASSAIEDIVLDQRRLERIVRGAHPRTRSEEEVAGYRDALDHLFGDDRPVDFGVVELLRLHRLLFSHTGSPGGLLKRDDNRVVDTFPNGLRVDRFRTVPARDTPFYVRELHHHLGDALGGSRHHPVFLIGMYVLDLLVIHPFDNGNGRVARLATTALLQAKGYDVVRYVAVEGLVDRTSDEYYASLKASTEGWHEGRHDVWPWLTYLIERIAEGYRTFDELAQQVERPGSKAARVERQVVELGPSVFSRDDVRAALPDVGDATITRVLKKLRDEGRIRLIGHGPSARWERIDRA
jgi:Fic family protein